MSLNQSIPIFSKKSHIQLREILFFIFVLNVPTEFEFYVIWGPEFSFHMVFLHIQAIPCIFRVRWHKKIAKIRVDDAWFINQLTLFYKLGAIHKLPRWARGDLPNVYAFLSGGRLFTQTGRRPEVFANCLRLSITWRGRASNIVCVRPLLRPLISWQSLKVLRLCPTNSTLCCQCWAHQGKLVQ